MSTNRTYVLFACFLSLQCPILSLAQTTSKLAGAHAVIDAAKYASLQAAIDAVPLSGGMLRLPPSEFIITEPLIIRHQDFRLEGAGAASHIKNANTDGQPAIQIRSDEFDADNKNERKPLWRVMLDNFRVTGNDKSGNGIEAVWINELFIQGVTVSHHGGDGVHCHFCVEDMRLNDSLITYNKKSGLRTIGNHDSIVSANHFEENFDGVVFMDGFNLTLTGNNIDDHLRHGVVVENASASIITGNMIEQCNGTGIVLDRDCYGISITGNVFAQDFGGGVDLCDAHGIPITGNSFMRVKQCAVRVSKNSGRSTISGNTFSDSWVGSGPKVFGQRSGDPNLNNSTGVLLESAHDMNIAGNTFTGLTTKPITIAGECVHIELGNNSITGCTEVDAKLDVKVRGGDALEIAAILHDETAFNGAHDVEVDSGFAYVSGKGGSLATLNVKQAAAPNLLWSTRDPQAYEDAESVLPLRANQLLVGTRDVLLFDVSSRSKPKLLASLTDRKHIDKINGFALLNDIAFGANKEGHIIAVDVSVPDELKLFGSRNARELDSLSSPHDAALAGDLLLIVSPEGFGRNSKPGKVAIYRVADARTHRAFPADQWELVSTLVDKRLAGANRVMTRGHFAYIGSSLHTNDERTDDLKSCVSVVDLSDPAKPLLRASIGFPDSRGPNGLEVAGTIVYAAGGQTVQAIDVSNSDKFVELSHITSSVAFPGGADDAHDLVYRDGYLFVTAQTSHSLVVLRVGEDARP